MAKEYSSILESINHGLSNPVQDEPQMGVSENRGPLI